MPYRQFTHRLPCYSILVLIIFFANGCAHTKVPCPDNRLKKARDALYLFEKTCQHKNCLQKYDELKMSYLQAQNAFYACRTKEAMEVAEKILKEVKELKCKPCPFEKEGQAATCGNKAIQKIISNNVLFGFDQAIPKSSAIEALEDILALMKKNVGYHVHLVGHTDSMGPRKYNLCLSKKRAEAVKFFLVNEGIAPERISAEGRGELEPIALNTTPAGRKKNRRTAVTLKYNPH